MFAGNQANGNFVQNGQSQYTNEVRGYYIHPKLMNYIAIWASPKYAVYVGEIMDTLNARIQITNETNQELISNLQKEVAKLKRSIEFKDQIIENQDNYIEKQDSKLDQQDQHIHRKSVRADNHNTNRDLYISMVEEGIYQLCANSHQRSQCVLKHWEFPSSMHVRKEVGFNLAIRFPYTFAASRLDTVVNEVLKHEPLVEHDPNHPPPKQRPSLKDRFMMRDRHRSINPKTVY